MRVYGGVVQTGMTECVRNWTSDWVLQGMQNTSITGFVMRVDDGAVHTGMTSCVKD